MGGQRKLMVYPASGADQDRRTPAQIVDADVDDGRRTAHP
jgi:hypothetical protein